MKHSPPGSVPVMALGGEFNLDVPLDRQSAETFVRLAEAFGVPCLDLKATRRR